MHWAGLYPAHHSIAAVQHALEVMLARVWLRTAASLSSSTVWSAARLWCAATASRFRRQLLKEHLSRRSYRFNESAAHTSASGCSGVCCGHAAWPSFAAHHVEMKPRLASVHCCKPLLHHHLVSSKALACSLRICSSKGGLVVTSQHLIRISRVQEAAACIRLAAEGGAMAILLIRVCWGDCLQECGCALLQGCASSRPDQQHGCGAQPLVMSNLELQQARHFGNQGPSWVAHHLLPRRG